MVLARSQTDYQNRTKAANKGGTLRRLSWKGSAGAGAGAVVTGKRQEAARGLAGKVAALLQLADPHPLCLPINYRLNHDYSTSQSAFPPTISRGGHDGL